MSVGRLGPHPFDHEVMPSEDPGLLVQGGRLPDWRSTERDGAIRLVPGRPIDVRIAGGVVRAVGAGLRPHQGEELLQVPEAVLLPGLHDHHVHLRALVAAAASVAVGPNDIAGEDALSEVLCRAPVDGSGWRRAVGYHESVAGDLDRARLDVLAPGPPTRVQHRTGAVWIVNSAAVEVLGLDGIDLPGVERDHTGRPTGRLLRLDAWLAARLAEADPVAELGVMSRHLASRGVTGVTDATPEADAEAVEAMVRAVDQGALVQRLHVMTPPGTVLRPHPLVSRGPHKILLDDNRLPSLERLVHMMRVTHASGFPVAVHCVTATQLALTVAAFESAGTAAGDRIEHGSVINPGFVGTLARLGLTVVTNPGFVHARGDSYVDEVDGRDVPHLYPCASLLAAGVEVGAGTDAPFGPMDPWTALACAVSRNTSGGRTLGAAEAVSLERAVGLFTGTAARPGLLRHVAVGEPGDLCALAAGPIGDGGQVTARATVVAGRVVHCL